MATPQPSTTDRFLGAPLVADGGPDWLRELRGEGARRFAATGLPTSRLEAWKFTDLRGLGKLAFAPMGAIDAGATGVAEGLLPAIDGPRLVFIDGRYSAALSRLDGLPAGVVLAPLSRLVADEPERARALLAEGSASDEQAMIALNTAGLEEGAVIRIRRGTRVEIPLVLAFVGGTTATPSASRPRNRIDVEDGAEVSILEHHAGPAGASGFMNMVTDISVGAGAVLRHGILQDSAGGAYDLMTVRARVAPDATYESFTFAVGARLFRNDATVRLQGRGANCRVSGAYLLRGEQHCDNATVIEHEQPHTTSREVFKGVVDDRARGIFQGRIVVHPGADKSNGHQMSKAILLSGDATVNAKPELEIFADDVKCSHGATVGELDRTAMFYLRSRGIPEARARSLLVEAFVAEALEELSDERLRALFAARAARWYEGVPS